MITETLYINSPQIIQNILINVFGWNVKRRRYNKNYWQYYETIANKSMENIGQVDLKVFRQFIFSASETIFWAERFRQFEFDIHAVDILSELKKLPILNKSEVKENIYQISNQSYKGPYNIAHTSGTTGSGMKFPQSLSMENAQWATWWRYRAWHGINHEQWMGWFGGRSILNINQKTPPFWIKNYPMKQIMFSAHHLNLNSVQMYFEQIVKNKLTWIHGYPSQIYYFSNLLREKNIDATKTSLRVITVGAENLSTYQKDTIESIFDAPLRQHYGLAEGVSNISENANSELILDQDFAYTELLPFHGGEVNQRKIVGTNYHNLKFPLIRYDTQDIATVASDGNNVQLVSIDGRQEDYIVLKNGSKLGRLDHIFKDLTHVTEAQIQQLSNFDVVIKIVKGVEYDDSKQEVLLISEARKRFGSGINLLIEYVENIERTRSGKLRFVISEIKADANN